MWPDNCAYVGCSASDRLRGCSAETSRLLLHGLTPPVGECLDSPSIDTPDAGESGIEMAGGNPPADIDICVVPDVLPTAVSVITEMSGNWININTPDTVESEMEITVEVLRPLVTLA